MSVDLPTPGSPPSRTSAPATTPPPKTRSNSPTPVETRGVSTPVMSLNGIGEDTHDAGLSTTAVIRSSTNVFHCWQTYCVFGFMFRHAYGDLARSQSARLL